MSTTAESARWQAGPPPGSRGPPSRIGVEWRPGLEECSIWRANRVIAGAGRPAALDIATPRGPLPSPLLGASARA
eukprot:4785242-Pyramimonas_sp.AAC.1